MNRKSLIVSIKSFKLSSQERSLFFSQKPWGIILFKRNIKNIKQLKQLTTDIRKLMRDPSYPILVDEEGGKVSRLTNIIDTKIFSQNLFGSLFEKDNFLGKNYYTYCTECGRSLGYQNEKIKERNTKFEKLGFPLAELVKEEHGVGYHDFVTHYLKGDDSVEVHNLLHNLRCRGRSKSSEPDL